MFIQNHHEDFDCFIENTCNLPLPKPAKISENQKFYTHAITHQNGLEIQTQATSPVKICVYLCLIKFTAV